MQYEEALKRLEVFSHTKNLDGFEKVADEIEREWGQWKEEDYFTLMLLICDLFNSVNFDDYAMRVALRQKYAALALEKPAQIPLEIELPLVIHAQKDAAFSATPGGGEEWAKQRSQTAEAWLRLGKRIEQEIDKDFDFKDVPQENIALPPGASGLAGMSPEYIEAPELRAEYEAAIERNRQKGENYRKQRKLCDLDEMFSSSAEQYIISAYSKPPFDLDELNHYLDSYLADRDRKERILEAVKQQMARSSE
jgi:hypothetical protein